MQHTITFTVSGSKVNIDKADEGVKPRDTVVFKSTNEQVFVTFDEGEWPFIETEQVIPVPGGGNSTTYTVVSAASLDHYTVANAGSTATARGEISIELTR